MTVLLDDPVLRTPAMMYLFHRVEERLDGSPAIIVVDEGWKALDDDVFVRRIKDWEKTIRKRNGIGANSIGAFTMAEAELARGRRPRARLRLVRLARPCREGGAAGVAKPGLVRF